MERYRVLLSAVQCMTLSETLHVVFPGMDTLKNENPVLVMGEPLAVYP